MSNIEKDIMSEEAFNELIDNFEVVETLTEYGRKAIKQNVKKLQQRIKELEKENKNWEKYCTEDLEKQITDLNNKNFELEYNSIPKQKVKELIKNETINISGFECISVEDLEKLF